MSDRVIGIDLGTTNSCIAVMEDDQARVLEIPGGHHTMPSIVAFNPDGSTMVGHIAKRQATTNFENTVFASKRLIGRNYQSDEVKTAIENSPYKIVPGPNSDPRVKIFEKKHPIPEISALILKQLKEIAQEALQETIEKVVITVPAYFSDGQRQATKDAGEIAGLDVLRIINEPTAAALAFGFQKRMNKRIAVYDLGGGTFDISVLEITGDSFEVLATAGNTYLGGEDFDQRLLHFIAEEFKKENGIDLMEDRMALQRLKDAAESAKMQLSDSKETEVNLPFITSQGDDSKHLKMVLKREQLEKLTQDFVDNSMTICQSALDMASLGKEDIDEIILVGGMTRMPLVQKKVEDFFGKPPAKNVHPDEAVALGAAIIGASLLEEESSVMLLDVTPMSLGIRTAGGYSSVLISRNSTIPISASQIFTTVADNQESVKIQVLQGENRLASENTLLGEFTLTDIPPAPAGSPEINVSFSIDSNGIVEVSAEDLKTKKAQSIVVTASSNLSSDELHDLVEHFDEKTVDLELSSNDS